MADLGRKLQHGKDVGGRSMAVSASALGSKDSLYTIQDAPAPPQHRIAAAPAQVRAWGEAEGRQPAGARWAPWRSVTLGDAGAVLRPWQAAGWALLACPPNLLLPPPAAPRCLLQGYDRYGEQNFSRNQVPAWG